MESPRPRGEGPPDPPEAEPYEAPAVAWEEPYDPVGLTISCAKWEGNPACEQLYLH
jgi:hypothetical protein